MTTAVPVTDTAGPGTPQRLRSIVTQICFVFLLILCFVIFYTCDKWMNTRMEKSLSTRILMVIEHLCAQRL